MVENRTRGKQLFEQEKGSQPSSGGGNSLNGKAAGIFQGIRDLFLKPWIRSGSKPGAETKAASAPLPEVFSAHKLDLKSINQVFALILAGLIALIVYFAFGEHPSISSVTAAVSKIKFQDPEDKTIASFQELAFYLDQVKKRDIFNKFEEPKPPPKSIAIDILLPSRVYHRYTINPIFYWRIKV